MVRINSIHFLERQCQDSCRSKGTAFLCFFRFETLEEVDDKCYLRIKLEDELVLISLANTLT